MKIWARIFILLVFLDIIFLMAYGANLRPETKWIFYLAISCILPFIIIAATLEIKADESLIRKGTLVWGKCIEAKLLSPGNLGKVNEKEYDDLYITLTMQFITTDGRQVVGKATQLESSLGRYRPLPETWMPVRYNPRNLKNVRIDSKADKSAMQSIDLLSSQSQISYEWTPENVTQQEAAEIKHRGIQVKCSILWANRTGKIVEDQCETDMEIAVPKPDGTYFNRIITTYLPPYMYSQIEKEKLDIQAFFKSDDEENIIFVMK